MKLRNLTLADQPVIERFLALRPRSLCAYAFPAMYIWRDLFDIRWQIIEDNLCVFFRDSVGQFVFTSPLGRDISPAAVKECFSIMDKTNVNPAVSRIENIAREDATLYEKLGYACRHKADEYVCSRLSLARLAGDRFKSKRASVNFFTKHYGSSYAAMEERDIPECLALCKEWMRSRAAAHRDDAFYCGMLRDSFVSLTAAFADYRRLKLLGGVVRAGRAVRAFTVGYRLTADTVCVLFEVADPSCKGAGQFIFQRFCQELEDVAWVNIMDDSGLANLRRVKLSYRPQKVVPGFIVTRT